MAEAGVRGAAGDTRRGGSCHPETPETCLAKATGGRIQARISTDQGPQVLRGWEPFLGGGESPRGSAAPLGTSARKHVTARPRKPGPRDAAAPHTPGACTGGTPAEHRPGRVANQGARGRQHPDLRPGPRGPSGARCPRPRPLGPPHTGALPVFMEHGLLGERSVPMEMSESDTLFPTGQTATPQRLRLLEPSPALLPDTGFGPQPPPSPRRRAHGPKTSQL